MNNTAEIISDDNCIHFISVVNPKKNAKIMLTIIAVLVLLIYISVVVYSVNESMSGGAVLALFVFAPIGLSITLGKYLFWNLYGKEEIILNTETLKYRRCYGIFTTKWTIVNYKPLSYQIITRRTDLDLSIIRIGSKTVMNVPIIIFTSTVLVPTVRLNEMIRRYEQLVQMKMSISDKSSVQA